jgi:hypothetical protein
MKITKGLNNLEYLHWLDYLNHIEKIVSLKGRKKEKRLKTKFNKLLKNNQTPNIPINTKTLSRNFVTNLSNVALTNEEMSLLNNGLKYKPPINPKDSKEQIIINIESKIQHLDKSEKLMIRGDCMKILKKRNRSSQKA